MKRDQTWLAAALSATAILVGSTAYAARPSPTPIAVATRAFAVPAVATKPPAPRTPTPSEVLAAQIGPSGCAVVIRDGVVVAETNADTAFAAASTQKILVAGAALETLGANHRFTTSVRASAVVAGTTPDIWLVGGADPLLSTSAYEQFLASEQRWKGMVPTSIGSLADRVVAAGVRHVTGRVVGDGSRHSGPALVSAWKPGYLSAGDISPLSGLTINGGYTTFAPKSASIDPTSMAAQVLTDELRQRGVVVDNDAITGSAPAHTSVVAAVSSAPLVDIVAGMLQSSDNVTAEMLTREVGLKKSRDGSTVAGTKAVVDVLKSAGINTGQTALSDGSGLASTDRTTCRTLASALNWRPSGVDMSPLLAVAGRTGTLYKRFKATELEGVLKAKSGWINGVVSLAGTIDLGRRVTFAVILNEVPSLSAGRRTEDSVLPVITALARPQ